MRINIERIDIDSLEALDIKNWEYTELDEEKVEEYYENDLLCYIKIGEATIITEFESILVKSGDLLTFPAKLEVIWDVDRKIKMLSIEKSKIEAEND